MCKADINCNCKNNYYFRYDTINNLLTFYK